MNKNAVLMGIVSRRSKQNNQICRFEDKMKHYTYQDATYRSKQNNQICRFVSLLKLEDRMKRYTYGDAAHWSKQNN